MPIIYFPHVQSSCGFALGAAVLCWKLKNDWAIETGVVNERDFARFEFNMIFEGLSCITTSRWLWEPPIQRLVQPPYSTMSRAQGPISQTVYVLSSLQPGEVVNVSANGSRIATLWCHVKLLLNTIMLQLKCEMDRAIDNSNRYVTRTDLLWFQS